MIRHMSQSNFLGNLLDPSNAEWVVTTIWGVKELLHDPAVSVSGGLGVFGAFCVAI